MAGGGVDDNFPTVAVAAAVLGWIAREQRMVAERNLQLALNSNNNLLQQIQDNLNRGRITAAVASSLVAEQVRTISRFEPGGSRPLTTTQVQLYLTLADTLTDEGDSQRAMAVLMNARQLAERLDSESGSSAESKRLLASVIWRIADVLRRNSSWTRRSRSTATRWILRRPPIASPRRM